MKHRFTIAALALLVLLLALRLGIAHRWSPDIGQAGDQDSRSQRSSSEETTAPIDSALSSAPSGERVERHQAGSIHGRIEYLDHSPVSGGILELRVASGKADGAQSWETRSSLTGEFQFEGLPLGRFQLLAPTEPGFVDASLEVSLAEQPQVRDLIVSLEEQRHLTVTVVDSKGAPVAGVDYEFRCGRSVSFPALTTDAAGFARWDFPPSVDQIVFEIEDVPETAGRYLIPPAIKLSPVEDARRVVLEETGTLTGVVVFEGGSSPCPHATIETLRHGTGISWTNADAEGRFSANVPVGESVSLGFVPNYRVGFPEYEHPEARLDNVRAGDRDRILIIRRLPRDRSVRIRVLGPEGDPVAGAFVVAVQGDSRRLGEAYSSESGVVEIAKLPHTELDIYVNLKNVETTGWLEPQGVIHLVPENQEVTYRFRRATFVEGSVLQPDGQPCPGARVSAHRDWSEFVRTDGEGRFRLFVDPEDVSPLTLEAFTNTRSRRLSATLSAVDRRGGSVVLKLEPKK